MILEPLPLCLKHRLQVILRGTHEAIDTALRQVPVVDALTAVTEPPAATDAIWTLLQRIRDAFGKDEKLHTATLLQRLDQHDLTPMELSNLLRPVNVKPRQMWLEGCNRSGYLAPEVRKALERMPRMLEPLERTEDGPCGYIDPATIPARPHESVVYFLRNGPRVKIGFTTNLWVRLATLCLRPTNVMLLLEGGQDLEDALHERFAAHRQERTEWFELVPELREYINAMRMKGELSEVA